MNVAIVNRYIYSRHLRNVKVISILLSDKFHLGISIYKFRYSNSLVLSDIFHLGISIVKLELFYNGYLYNLCLWLLSGKIHSEISIVNLKLETVRM